MPASVSATTAPTRSREQRLQAARPPLAPTYGCSARRASSSGSDTRLPSSLTTRSRRPCRAGSGRRRRTRWCRRCDASHRGRDAANAHCSAPSSSRRISMPAKRLATHPSDPADATRCHPSPYCRRFRAAPRRKLRHSAARSPPRAGRPTKRTRGAPASTRRNQSSAGQRDSCAGVETTTAAPHCAMRACKCCGSMLSARSNARPAASGHNTRNSRP